MFSPLLVTMATKLEDNLYSVNTIYDPEGAAHIATFDFDADGYKMFLAALSDELRDTVSIALSRQPYRVWFKPSDEVWMTIMGEIGKKTFTNENESYRPFIAEAFIRDARPEGYPASATAGEAPLDPDTTSGFPRYTAAAQKGELGVKIVGQIIDEEFGWIFKRNHQEHDLGIDGQIEVVTGGFATGQMLACQIKCGQSFFKETNRWGYIYRGELKHFNYLANYPVPVIITICDPDTKEAYWVCFEAGTARVTEGGWVLTIPYANKLASSKAELLAFLPAVTDKLGELDEYWAVHGMLPDFGVIIVNIEIDDVRAMDTSFPRVFFDNLRATKELAYGCQGKIEILFWGYEDDPRELFEIDEVRQYVGRLDAVLPELFFFARADDDAVTLRLFMHCLMAVGWASDPAKQPRYVDFDLTHLDRFLERHFLGLNEIAEWIGLSEEELKAISDSAVKALHIPQAETKP